ncbi:MAG: selenium cofactor biosynthesis protein YqeC [Candidatus Krumholzibacteriota bacterium]
MNFGFVDPWHQFLPREAGHVVALMGSGGKTSLMRVLADFYVGISVPVVLTTTTRSEPLPGLEAVELSTLASLDGADLPEAFFLHGGLLPDGKWAGLSPAEVDGLGGSLPDRLVLAEVDGAAKLPLKLHRDGEPVWPGRTSLGIVVMGTAAVGAKTADVLHRFGRLEGPALDDLQPWTVWEWDHSLALLLEPEGYLSRVPADIPCVLALTGMDEQPDSIGLFEFVGKAMGHERLPLVMFCDLAQDQPVIRTAYAKEDGQS